MKRLLILITILSLSVAVSAQKAIFDIGIKGGINSSKVSLKPNDYNESNILKMHFGAFARLGFGSVFVQPEAYFTKKGGEFHDVIDLAGDFNYSAVDVPVLLGVNLMKGTNFNLHVMGGPVFGYITKDDVDYANFDQQFFKDHYVGLQYGAGIDVYMVTLDFRFENGNTVYKSDMVKGKNATFMVSLGIKLL
ncbi:MAG TPA: porin family protein [Draconibacterium sp.]|nr:porin family protein [Draconibacterium sp.]